MSHQNDYVVEENELQGLIFDCDGKRIVGNGGVVTVIF